MLCSMLLLFYLFVFALQVLIFYGPRSNAELLLHNGFVFDANEHDRLAIRIGIIIVRLKRMGLNVIKI